MKYIRIRRTFYFIFYYHFLSELVVPEHVAEIHNKLRRMHKDTGDVSGSKEMQVKATNCAMEILNKKENPCQLPSKYGRNVVMVHKSLKATFLKAAILHWYKVKCYLKTA